MDLYGKLGHQTVIALETCKAINVVDLLERSRILVAGGPHGADHSQAAVACKGRRLSHTPPSLGLTSASLRNPRLQMYLKSV